MEEAVYEFHTFPDAVAHIRDYEVNTNSQFVVCRATTNFNKSFIPSLDDLKKTRIRYSGSSTVLGPIELGQPFIFIGSSDLSCIHGRCRKTKTSTISKVQGDHGYCRTTSKKRMRVQPSKKQNCRATIKVQEVLCFEGLRAISKKRRDTVSKLLKTGVSFPAFQRLFIVGKKASHQRHVIGKISGVNKSVSKDIIQKIHQLVSSGEVNVPRIKSELAKFVDNLPLIKKPSLLNRQYFPSQKTIYNHVQTALSNSRYSDEEQLNVENYLQKLSETYPGMKYYFRAHSDIQQEKFLLVLQMPWQAELLKKFDECLLVDSTFNTSKYKLPLFEVVTFTNVGYFPVCIFITEDELESSVTDGLRVMKSWHSNNANWIPSSFITDCDAAQSKAIQAVFPDTSQYWCKFHIEQAWKRWLSRHDNGLVHEMDEALRLCIAASSTKEDFAENVAMLKVSKLWKDNGHFQTYIRNTWLSNSERWVRAFRKLNETIVVTTTNGVEVHHRILKSLLKEHGYRTAQSLLEVLATKYFTQSLESVADKYNIFVLLKEILIILQMKNTEQPYCVAEEKLEADEFIV